MDSFLEKRRFQSEPCCFFCLQEPETCDSQGRSQKDASFHQLSLRNISRYLASVHPEYRSEITLNYLARRNASSSLDNLSSWIICECCAPLAFEFNELYHLMEVIKLRLNWSLDQMMEVMTSADKKNHAVARKHSREDHDLRAAIFGQMKGLTPVPRVVLCRTEMDVKQERTRFSNDSDSDDDMDFNPDDDCRSSDGITAVSSSSAPASPKNVNVDIKIKMECDAEEELPNKSPRPPRITIESIYNDDSGESNGSTQDITSQRKLDEDGIETSANRFHNGITKDQVGVFSQNLMELRFEGGNEPVKIYAESRGKINCSFCRALFHQKSSLPLHMIQHHCDQLFQHHKLDLVTDAQFKKILGELLFKDLINEKGDTVCLYCSKIFKNDLKMKKSNYHVSVKAHLFECHYEELGVKLCKLQRSPNLIQLLAQCESSGEICRCGTYLQNRRIRRQHHEWHCNLTEKRGEREHKSLDILSRFDSVPSPSSSSAKVPKLACNSCKKTCVNPGSARRHWKYFCGQGPRLPQPNTAILNCPHCSYKCKLEERFMRRHVALRHSEVFFLSERDADSLSKWKHDHFKRIVVKILLPEFIVRNQGTSPSTSCPVCGKKYECKNYVSNRCTLKVHVINNHIGELRELLKRILTMSDASLQKQLQQARE